MKRSKVLLISAILGTLYSIFLITHFAGANANTYNSSDAIAAGIATALVMPHMLLVCLATVFNWLAWLMTSKGFAITTGVLFSVGAAVFPLYAMFLIPMIILSFVGVSKVNSIKGNKVEYQAMKPIELNTEISNIDDEVD